jgi:Uma2 family endonuclease
MTQAKPRFQTLEEYLNYDNRTDTRYELVNGELVELPTEEPINSTIAMVLAFAFGALGIRPRCLAIGHQIEVESTKVTARQPDLVVHSKESLEALLSKEKLIRLGMPAPLLVVEVVSPGEPGSDNYNRDYIEKPREYATRGIPEFWQIDPERAVVNVLELVDGAYQSHPFRGSDRIVSPQFPHLQLTAAKILGAQDR